MRIIYFHTPDGCMLCPDCNNENEENEPVFEVNGFRFGENCDECLAVLVPDAFGSPDWLRLDEDFRFRFDPIDWRSYSIRWGRCSNCGSQRPWNTQSPHYRYARRESLSGGYRCPECGEKKARF